MKPWRTANGRVIPLADMETIHLQNAVAVMERQGRESFFPGFATVEDLQNELRRRGVLPPKPPPEKKPPQPTIETKRFAELDFEDEE